MKTKKGFTLIELLVVISIIGILMSFAFVSYTSAQKSARDTQRKSDLNQYRIALENYSVAYGGKYPANDSQIWENGDTGGNFFTESGAIINEYIPAAIKPPRSGPGTARYFYFVDENTYRNYVLIAILEVDTTKYWEICSDGRSGEMNSSAYAWGDATCDL